jgi:hypothetical protein
VHNKLHTLELKLLNNNLNCRKSKRLELFTHILSSIQKRFVARTNNFKFVEFNILNVLFVHLEIEMPIESIGWKDDKITNF